MLELQRLLALPLLSQLFDEQRRGGGAYAAIGQAARRKGMVAGNGSVEGEDGHGAATGNDGGVEEEDDDEEDEGSEEEEEEEGGQSLLHSNIPPSSPSGGVGLGLLDEYDHDEEPRVYRDDDWEEVAPSKKKSTTPKQRAKIGLEAKMERMEQRDREQKRREESQKKSTLPMAAPLPLPDGAAAAIKADDWVESMPRLAKAAAVPKLTAEAIPEEEEAAPAGEYTA